MACERLSVWGEGLKIARQRGEKWKSEIEEVKHLPQPLAQLTSFANFSPLFSTKHLGT